jgi:hypothetical protein
VTLCQFAKTGRSPGGSVRGVDLGATAARLVLPVLGLPRAPLQPADPANWPTSFTDPAAGPTPTPRPVVPYLQWLAETRPVVFHGSRQRGLVELRDERKSRDARAYGDQTAVFASQDPIWALFFAVLRRDALRSTRNASYGPDAGVRGRRYLFSVDAAGPLFAPGALYVLPEDGFAHEPRTAGVFDTAHRTRIGSVRPLAWFDVEPGDFPFADRTTRHNATDSLARTVWTAGWAYRRH